MGLFDFIKNKKSGITPPPIPDASTPHPIPQQEFVQELKAECVKNSFEDFFTLDICHLEKYFNGNHEFSSIREGTTPKRVTIVPVDSDMGLFYKAIITQFETGEFNVELWADRKELTTELCDFVQFCTKVFGKTKAGDGIITEKDHYLMSAGSFSRMWDKIWIDIQTNNYDQQVITMTLFSPKQIDLENVQDDDHGPINDIIPIIQRFFQTDLDNLPIGDDDIFDTNERDGALIVRYKKNLQYSELGLFNVLEVIKRPDGTYCASFISNSCEINNQFKDFVDCCAAVLGPDLVMKRGKFTKLDDDDAYEKSFSRYWHQIHISQNEFDEDEPFNITIHNVNRNDPTQ